MRQLLTFLCLLLCATQVQAQVIFHGIDLGPYDSNPGLGQGFFVYNDKMYFQATDTAHGTELWISDGTAAGSKMLVDLSPGLTSTTPWNFIEYNGKMFFQTLSATADTLQIWSSDGTAAGTQHIKTIVTSDTFRMYAPDCAFTLCNGKLYFAASSPGVAYELWICDGTEAGTHMVKDINKSADPFNVSSPIYLTAYNNKLYFLADDSVHGRELWVSDGTEAGTQLFIDLNPGTGRSYGQHPFVFNGQLYFYGYSPAYGNELWVTDGTTSGTQLFMDFVPGTNGSVQWTGGNSSYAIYNGKLYLGNFKDTTNYLWVTDGTIGNVQLVDSFRPGLVVNSFNEYNSLLYFNAPAPSSSYPYVASGMWSTDGTTSGTKLIVNEFAIGAFTIYRNKAYFTGQFNDVFVTDGTKHGTGRAGNGFSTANISSFVPYTVYHDKMYFPAVFSNSSGAEMGYLEGYFPISIPNITKQDALQLYPNPTNGNFTINIPAYNANDNNLLTVYDMTGKLVHSQTITTATTQLQLGNLPKGMYEVKLGTRSAGLVVE